MNTTSRVPQNSRKRRIVLAAAVFCLIGLVYSNAVEPYWIEVTHHVFYVPQGVALSAPLKIAHLTDLHTSGLGRREQRVLAILEEERPDLIVITGDTIAKGASYKETRELLSRLRAPLGVYLVRGNWENWIPPGNERSHYALTGVHLLVNEGAAPRADLWLAGTDDSPTGFAHITPALAGAPQNALRIAMFHSPLYFEKVASQVHLALAGHSHGGQVRIPFLPALWLPRGVGPYVEGWFEREGSRMYVSRGVGTSILPFRFACRPEVAIIELRNQN